MPTDRKTDQVEPLEANKLEAHKHRASYQAHPVQCYSDIMFCIRSRTSPVMPAVAMFLRLAVIAVVITGTPDTIEVADAQAVPATPVVEKCAECGVVDSMREVDPLGEEVDSAVAGSPTKRYEVTVRMKDGATRVVVDVNPASWRVGERVTLIEGAKSTNSTKSTNLSND